MAVYVFSGGQDSTVALAMGLHRGDRSACALTIDYGQRNRGELTAALAIVGILSNRFRESVHHYTLDISCAARTMWDGCTLVSKSARVTGSTAFVPGRNAVFLAAAASFAANNRYGNRVVFGTTAVDASGSADGSSRFTKAFAAAFNSGLPRDARLKFEFPLQRKSKGDVLVEALRLGILDEVKYECVSCHNDDRTEREWGRGCGSCSACRWRKVGWDEFNGRRRRKVR